MAKASKSSKSKKPARTSAKAAPAVIKPVANTMSKSELARHLAEASGVEPKQVKAVLASLETTMLGAVHKKGARLFVLPGLLKVTAQAVAAKPKRQGKDPFTGETRWFAAKPASVRIKARALKKLKDAAL